MRFNIENHVLSGATTWAEIDLITLLKKSYKIGSKAMEYFSVEDTAFYR